MQENARETNFSEVVENMHRAEITISSYSNLSYAPDKTSDRISEDFWFKVTLHIQDWTTICSASNYYQKISTSFDKSWKQKYETTD